jgi:predicted amidohydrolase
MKACVPADVAMPVVDAEGEVVKRSPGGRVPEAIDDTLYLERLIHARRPEPWRFDGTWTKTASPRR